MADGSFIEKNKAWLLPVLVILVGLGIGYSVWSTSESGTLSKTIDQAYFSDDDGKTYFADSINKRTPFDHNGKQAVCAFVYTCPDKKEPFVAFLGRHTNVPVAAAPVGGMKSDPPSGPTEFKKPGDTKWVGINSPEGQAMTTVTCKGGGSAEGLIPGA